MRVAIHYDPDWTDTAALRLALSFFAQGTIIMILGEEELSEFDAAVAQYCYETGLVLERFEPIWRTGDPRKYKPDKVKEMFQSIRINTVLAFNDFPFESEQYGSFAKWARYRTSLMIRFFHDGSGLILQEFVFQT